MLHNLKLHERATQTKDLIFSIGGKGQEWVIAEKVCKEIKTFMDALDGFGQPEGANTTHMMTVSSGVEGGSWNGDTSNGRSMELDLPPIEKLQDF